MTARDRLAELCEGLGLSYTEVLRAPWGHEVCVSDRAGTRWQTTAETLDGAVENLAVILALHADGVAVRLLREGADRTHHTRTTWVREGVLVEAWRRGQPSAPRIAATGRSFAEAVERLLEQMP